MRQPRQDDGRSVSSDLGSGVTREQYTQTPAQCTEQALADLGVPKARRRQVVNNRGSTSPGDVRGAAFNRPGDDWRPQYPAKRGLSDRAPFATALSGYDPSRVELEGYESWTAGG